VDDILCDCPCQSSNADKINMKTGVKGGEGVDLQVTKNLKVLCNSRGRRGRGQATRAGRGRGRGGRTRRPPPYSR